MEEEKKRIRPVVVESEGEAVVSPELPKEPEASKAKEEEASESSSKKESHPETPPASDAKPDVKVVEKEAPPAPEEKKSSSLTFILVTILVALFVALLAGGVYVYVTGTQNVGQEATTPLPSPTPILPEAEPAPAMSPEASPTADVADLKVSVLNGSGKIGEAGKVKALLEKGDFVVANTGNAASFDFAKTQVQTKSEVSPAVVAKLKEALTGYLVEEGEALPASSNYDILVTVGAK